MNMNNIVYMIIFRYRKLRYGDGLVDERFFLDGFKYFRHKFKNAVFIVVSICAACDYRNHALCLGK